MQLGLALKQTAPTFLLAASSMEPPVLPHKLAALLIPLLAVPTKLSLLIAQHSLITQTSPASIQLEQAAKREPVQTLQPRLHRVLAIFTSRAVFGTD